MKAIVYEKTGGEDNLQLKEVPTPEPGPGQVRIKIAYCGVNPVDRIGLSGTYPVTPMPHIPGSEITGVVDALGAGVDWLETGQPVALACKTFCGSCRFCLAGHEEICARGGILGIVTQGGYADYIVAPARLAVNLPTGLSLKDAAAMVLATTTAWHMMIERAQVRAGERVVIFGATGSVGSAAVQICKMAGARVTAVTGPGKAAEVLELGAHSAVERGPDMVERILDETGGGADVVCNPIGAAVWDESLAVLIPHGRWTTCGVLTGDNVKLAIRPLYNKEFSLIGSTGGTRKDLASVLKATDDGDLQPTIWKTFPLEQAVDALKELDDKSRVGKILIEM